MEPPLCGAKRKRRLNTTAYANAEVDALIDAASASVDTAERMDLYHQIRAIVTKEAPIVFAHFETLNDLMTKSVSGSTISPTLSLHMENAGFFN